MWCKAWTCLFSSNLRQLAKFQLKGKERKELKNCTIVNMAVDLDFDVKYAL